MDISVIVPTYKPQAYLWECLDSLCAQTFPKEKFEVVIVLNGCSEPYDSQIRSYLQSRPDMNWHYVQTDAPGVSNARNIGLDEARGEYITFVDDDDLLSPSCLESLAAVSSADCIGICRPQSFVEDIHNTVPNYQDGAYAKAKERSGGKAMGYRGAARLFAVPWMKLIHRSVIGDRRFNVRFRNGEDSIFMFLVSDRFGLVRFASEEAVYFRRIRKGGANLSMTVRGRTRNSLRMMAAYTRIYLSRPSAYSLPFLLTRITGACKTILVG